MQKKAEKRFFFSIEMQDFRGKDLLKIPVIMYVLTFFREYPSR
jgi:hypothetical protein